MMSDLKIRSVDSDLKKQLEDLAHVLGVSVSDLCKNILAAQFNDKDKMTYQLMLDLAEFKRLEGLS